MRPIKTFLFILILLSGCIGTDYQDDPKDAAVLVNVTNVNLLVGQSKIIEATFWYNMWKPEPSQQLTWESENTAIATVDQSGQVTGVSRGQTQVIVYNPGEDTASVLVSVVASNLDVARVTIQSSQTAFNIGETIQLTARAFDADDNEVADKNASWSSENTNIVTVDGSGLATAVADGEANVTANIDGVNSMPYKLMVGVQARNGTFQGSGSYNTAGTATLFINDNNDVILELGEDFETDFALGTFAYLANSTSGTVVRSQGLEIAEITGNGTHTFNISNINSSVTLEQYDYVIMLCKPASITFGFAELN